MMMIPLTDEQRKRLINASKCSVVKGYWQLSDIKHVTDNKVLNRVLRELRAESPEAFR